MRQKIAYVFKYNLLTALLLTGAICCAVGVTWCRYQKTIEAPASFIIEGPGNFVILGPEEGTKPGVWHVDEEAGLARMDFQVANGVDENFSTEDGVFRLRLLATEGIPANAEVSLVVISEDGIRQTYPIHAEQIMFEGKYLALCNEMGDGTRYRFMEGERELVLKLDGGKRSVLKCSIVVKGNVEPFLAELQLIDAAYGNEADILTNYVDKVEEKPSFLLPQWTSGEEPLQTELLLSTQDSRTEGKLIVCTESTLVSPVFESMDVTDKETVQELEVIVEPDEVQEVKLLLVPDETLLKELTEPVTVKADVTWSFTNEAGETEELAVELVAVLNPTKALMPSEPSEESSEAGSEPSEESSESESVPSEESSEDSSEPSEDSSEGSSEPSEENTEGSEEPSEESSEDREEPSEESNEESSEAAEAEGILMLTLEIDEIDISTEEEEARELNESGESTEAGEPSESSESTEAGEPSDSSESSESTEASEPSESSESTEASEPSISTEEEEEAVFTFVVKKQNAKHQMALTGLVQKLSLTESIAGQVTYIGEETPTTSQQLQELHMVSHLAGWGFHIPESNLVVETTVEALTTEGYQKVENSPAPKVTISNVTEGDYEGGKLVAVQGNNALAGTYRLILTQKTDNNLVLHTEYIPIFVNYRFEDALKAEAQEE